MATAYRGPLAIHTSKKIDKTACRHAGIQALLGKHGYSEKDLPASKIIAECRLEKCLRVIESNQESAILEDGRMVTGNVYEYPNPGLSL